MYVDKPLVGHQGGADAVAPEPRAPAEARRVRARLPERRRDDPGRVRRLLPHDDPERGDRPEQAARPEGDAGRLPGLRAGAGRRRWSSCTSAAPTATSSTRSSTPASRPTWSDLDEDGQVDFKGKAKAFARTYGFLASILPYTNAEWEKLSIFLNFLIPKLPAPKEEDLVEGHPRSHRHGQLPGREAGGDEDRACRTRTPRSSPCRRAAAGASPSPSWTGSRNILKTFNDQFGNISWTDADRIAQAHHRGDPAEGRGGRGLPERARSTPTSRTPASSTTRRWSG